jgi:CO/xanthine dehydrogenase Mo-binding subunit
MVNPLIVDRQIIGGVAQGIGWSMLHTIRWTANRADSC